MKTETRDFQCSIDHSATLTELLEWIQSVEHQSRDRVGDLKFHADEYIDETAFLRASWERNFTKEEQEIFEERRLAESRRVERLHIGRLEQLIRLHPDEAKRILDQHLLKSFVMNTEKP